MSKPFNITVKQPKVWAIVRTKSGKLEKREVVFNRSNHKLKDAYIKDFNTGLYLKYGTANLDKIKDKHLR